VGSSIIPAVAGLVVANIQLQEAKVAFDRMHEVAGLPVEEGTEKAKSTLRPTPTLLTVQNLAFRYPGRSQILKDVSFELHPGKRVGFFAPVGIGKSTLVELIQKFYTPESGEIRLPFLENQNPSLSEWRGNWPSFIRRKRSSTVPSWTTSSSAAIPKKSKPRCKSCRNWVAFHSSKISVKACSPFAEKKAGISQGDSDSSSVWLGPWYSSPKF